MHFQFLIEDQSSEKLIHALMLKVVAENTQITYQCKSFRGIGGFTKKNTVKETKTGKLLNDLATYLRGFNKSLCHVPSTIFIVLDCDDQDENAFRTQLEQVAHQNNITVDHVFALAVEEVEAWLLGDSAALLKAYPRARQQVLQAYVQDSVCGTWETLADAIYLGGYSQLKKDCFSYVEVGRIKAEWSQKIGIHMDLTLNKSPSFHQFVAQLYQRI